MPKSDVRSSLHACVPELLRATGIAPWTHSSGVLVIGYGAAGASATIAVRELGAEVLVLERASGPGGGVGLLMQCLSTAAARACRRCSTRVSPQPGRGQLGAHRRRPAHHSLINPYNGTTA